MRISVKAYSRAVIDDSGKLSPYEYNGSFGVSVQEWQKASIDKDTSFLYAWHKMMDCFFECLFINQETNEVLTFNLYND